MKSERRPKGILTALVVLSLIIGLVGGYVLAHRSMATTSATPDLLATQDEYLLALRSQAQLAGSPMLDAKIGAEALVSSARERLKLWSFTDQQIAELERRGKAEPVITVYAPSTGIVLKREALPGKYVDPGTTLYELADLSTAWIYADVYESEIAAVKLIQP